jgi:hypothetical protein
MHRSLVEQLVGLGMPEREAEQYVSEKHEMFRNKP